MGSGNNSFNFDIDGAADDGAPESKVAQSEHIISSANVDSAVGKPIVLALGNGNDSVGEETGGSTTGSESDHTEKTPKPGTASHKSHVAGSNVPRTKSIVSVPSA